VSASPVPLDQILSYRLLAGSTYQRGCFGACECADGPLEPILGTFALVPLEGTALSHEFAVVNADWLVLDPSGTIPVRGLGTYRMGGKFALEQELILVLNVREKPPVYFDSGLVSGGSNFPSLDIGISVSGAICFNTWIDLHAAPGLVRPAKAKPSGLTTSD